MRAIAEVSAEHALERLLPALLKIAVEATSSDAGALFLHQGTRAELVKAAAQGYPLSGGPPDGPAKGWSTAQIDELRRAGFLESVLLPLQLEGLPAGTLSLSRLAPSPYTEPELDSAQAIAQQLALQIERAQLVVEAQRRQRLLSLSATLTALKAESSTVKELVERVLAAALTALDIDAMMIHLVRGSELVLAGLRSNRAAGAPREVERLQRLQIDERTLSGRAALTRAPVLVDFESWPSQTLPVARAGGGRHALAAPLLAGSRVVGTLCVIRRRDQPFAADEQQLVDSCAAQLALLIDQLRLLEDERSRADDLSLINRVGGLGAEPVELAAVLDAGVAHLASIVHAQQAFLGLLEGGGFRVVSCAEENDGVRGALIPLSEAHAARTAVETLRPVVVDDTRSDLRASAALGTRFHYHVLMAVPLVSRGVAIGVAIIGDGREGRSFTPAELERAVAVTNQLASFIANARLYDDLKRSYGALAEAQQELVRRERLAALGELAAVVAHEVKNPLGVIFNAVAGLRRAPEGSPGGRLLVNIVAEEAERLDRIVSDLLAFARPGALELSPHSLGAIIAGAAEAASRAFDGAGPITLELAVALPPVQADPQRLRQAFVNLFLNALQVVPGGPVTVRAVAGESPRCLRVEVIDRGPGIPEEVSARLFEPFFTTKAQGTGLGLTIVKRIVEAHRGEVSFLSRLGGGTTFTLRLPLEG